jgi:toxin-antitoxin system PIN domain toxin
MALLDVNALVALVWDSHVHHAAMRRWFACSGSAGWSTCPVSESGFVRVSSNPKVLAAPVSVSAARDVLRALRANPHHRFLTDDVSVCQPDFPTVHGHRQVTDAHLLTLARRHDQRLITFDAGIAALDAGSGGVELLSAF